MMTIAIWYLALCLFIFMRSINYQLDGLRRAKLFLLALTLLSFGAGRFLYFLDPKELPEFTWMFTMGHFAMGLFAILYTYSRKEASA